ncbi:MAG TPA: Ig-like domain repeat protein, partial [Solirubrobacteraceae bacterium]
TTPPTISISSPEDGEIVNQATKLTASYVCSDGESGVASCEGSVPSGSSLDTSSLGEHTLSVAASDHAGNGSSGTAHYIVVEPGECGESVRLCQTGLGDETPPSVAGLTLSPASVDTSTASKSVVVVVHATDDLSGVSAVQVSLSNGSRWISAPASLTAGGTRLDGTWEAKLTVPKGSAEGSYALSVAVIDSIGNHRTYSAHELEVLGLPSALTETGGGDATPPWLSGASASPASVSTCGTPASTTIGVQASDSSGVAYVNVDLTGPGGQSLSAPAVLDSGSAASGHWSAPLTLPQHAEQGSWAISIQMGDTAGNPTYISSAQLSAAGFGSVVQQTCAGDTNPPQIASVALAPETVDTSTGSRAVVLDVHATDDLSGVASLQATLISGGQSQSASALLQSGTVLDGTWQATITLPRWSQQGTWRLDLIVTDQVGNSVSLSPSQVTALGLPDSVAQTGEGDSTAPTASSGSIAPSSFDTSQHPVSVSVHLHVADVQSGTELVRVAFTSPNGGEHVYGEASLTSGSPQEGEWTATLEFPQFSQQGSWSPQVELWDAFGNRRAYAPAELATVFPPIGVAQPPEFGRCVKVAGEKVKSKTFYHGGFAAATCLEASESHTGKYEWEAGVAKAHFTTQIKEPTKVTLETVNGAKMVCAGETGTGEYAGFKTVQDVALSFTGCELVKGSVACTSAGAAAGEVVSHPLEGILGVEALGATPSANKIGLDLYPVGKTGPLMMFACAGTSASITGSVIVPVAENKMGIADVWKAVAAKGRQHPESFLEAPVDVLDESLNAATPEQIGLKLTSTQTSEEPVEINTVF